MPRLADPILASGQHEPGSRDVLGMAAMRTAARQGMVSTRDPSARFDGVWVLAPGGQASTTLRTPR